MPDLRHGFGVAQQRPLVRALSPQGRDVLRRRATSALKSATLSKSLTLEVLKMKSHDCVTLLDWLIAVPVGLGMASLVFWLTGR